MFEMRKVLAVMLLFAFSAALTAAWNEGFGFLEDLNDPKVRYPYLPGLGAVVMGIFGHLFFVRNFLPIRHTLAQVLGILISGFFAIVMYARLMHLMASPNLFFPEIPRLFWFAVFSGWLWFPLLTLLEHWAYRVNGREQVRGSVTNPPEEFL